MAVLAGMNVGEQPDDRAANLGKSLRGAHSEHTACGQLWGKVRGNRRTTGLPGGEHANNQCVAARCPQPGNAGRAAPHKLCGRAIAVLPGPMAVVPTIHRAYYDYVLFSFKVLNNQRRARGKVVHPGRPGTATVSTPVPTVSHLQTVPHIA